MNNFVNIYQFDKMGVMNLGYQIIKNFLQIANDDSVFMICNTLIDLGVVYVASFYLE